MRAVFYITGISHIVALEMARSIHTPARCLSKPRSSLGAGKKQPRVWLDYVCCVAKMLLYPSFGAPLVLLWSPYGESEDARYIHGGFSEPSRRCYGVRSEVYVLGNIGGVVNEAGFNASRTYVHGPMNLCS